jgi:hypothetical protein
VLHIFQLLPFSKNLILSSCKFLWTSLNLYLKLQNIKTELNLTFEYQEAYARKFNVLQQVENVDILLLKCTLKDDINTSLSCVKILICVCFAAIKREKGQTKYFMCAGCTKLCKRTENKKKEKGRRV